MPEITKWQNRDRAVEGAMALYDQGKVNDAITHFVSEMKKHEDTRWVADHHTTLTLLRIESGSSQRFKKVMLDFKI